MERELGVSLRDIEAAEADSETARKLARIENLVYRRYGVKTNFH